MKVFVAGTFDLFHVGHQYTLWTASKEGSEMVVVVARDATVENIKSKKTVENQEDRLERVKQEDLPNATVRLGREDADFAQTLQEEQPDVICLGYDQRCDEEWVLQILPNVQIKRMAPYHPQFFKSSLIAKQT